MGLCAAQRVADTSTCGPGATLGPGAAGTLGPREVGMTLLFWTALAACTLQPASPPPAAPAPAPVETHTAPAPPEPPCPDTLAQDYLTAREALNRCETEAHCEQVWPGACPHGPYFVDSRADAGPVLALERQLEDCSTIECEPPMELEPAGCVDGRCVPGAHSSVLPRR